MQNNRHMTKLTDEMPLMFSEMAIQLLKAKQLESLGYKAAADPLELICFM